MKNQFKLEQAAVWYPSAGEEQAEILVDQHTGAGWFREVADKRYAGTYGRETPVYGTNPHGVVWYRLEWNAEITTATDWREYESRGKKGVLFCSGAWVPQVRPNSGTTVHVNDGRQFARLEATWKRLKGVEVNN